VLGYDADTYGPRDHVRRDQMASFIARAIDYVHNGEVDGSAPPQSEGANYFTDVFAANTHSMRLVRWLMPRSWSAMATTPMGRGI
jgi:hypothetical protein